MSPIANVISQLKLYNFKLLIPLALTAALTAYTAIIRRPRLWKPEVQLL